MLLIMFVGLVWLWYSPLWRTLLFTGIVMGGVTWAIAQGDFTAPAVILGSALNAAIFWAIGAVVVAVRKWLRSRESPLLRSLT